jgi:hypothetical protein
VFEVVKEYDGYMAYEDWCYIVPTKRMLQACDMINAVVTNSDVNRLERVIMCEEGCMLKTRARLQYGDEFPLHSTGPEMGPYVWKDRNGRTRVMPVHVTNLSKCLEEGSELRESIGRFVDIGIGDEAIAKSEYMFGENVVCEVGIKYSSKKQTVLGSVYQGPVEALIGILKKEKGLKD